MPSILGANTLASGYDVANSLRFDDGSSAFLSKTFSGDGTSHDVGTVSVWLKRSELSDEQGIFTAGSSNRHFIRFETGGNLTFRAVTDSFHVQTNQLFRDSTAWYHIVIAYDTSDGTASNRVKMYVNGSQVTSFAQTDYPDQNLDIKLGAAELNCIGKDAEQTNPYYDGYMAEFAYIDGQQLAASSFGEFDEDSPTIWKPKNFKGDVTFGTNGFYMEFKQTGTSANSSGMGADTSGNDNHFATSGLASTDVTEDTCTNNFATISNLNVNAGGVPTFAEGNLDVTVNGATGTQWGGSSTLGVTTGKWYAEVKAIVIDSAIVGIDAATQKNAMDDVYPGQQNEGVGILLGSGNKYIDDSGTTHGAAFSTNDILMIALDLDNNDVYFGKNGQWFDGSGNADESSPNSAIDLTGVDDSSAFDGAYFFAWGDGGGSSAARMQWNFGNPPFSISSGNTDGKYGNFEYAPPSGYYALCTKRLAEFG